MKIYVSEKVKQLIYIALGFFLGQGAMFFAQTYLIFRDKLELVGAVGIGLGLLSLVQWFADMGGMFLFPKYTSESRRNVYCFFIARIICLPFLLLITWGAYDYLSIGEVSKQIFIFGCPVAIIGVFNIVGVVDYFNKNKFSSPYSGISWAISSVVLVIFSDSDELGYYLGSSYTLGLLISTVIQYFSLKKEILKNIKYHDYIELDKLTNIIIESISYNLYYSSSQIYGRMIPVIIESSIGVNYSGIYIYARNITNIIGQFIMFSRRVEYKSLLSYRIYNFNVLGLFSRQKISIIVSVGYFLICFVLYAVNLFGLEGKLINNDIVDGVFWLSINLMLFSISSIFSQYLIVIDKTKQSAFFQLIFVVINFLIVFALINSFEILSVYISEIITNCIRIVALTLYIYHIKVRNVRMEYGS